MRISILGCGWLGLKLAEKLIDAGHHVKGSVTSMEKIEKLSELGIEPFAVKLFESGIQGDIRTFMEDSEVLIIDIPPGLRKDPETDFAAKMKNLIPHIHSENIQKVIFISSTSVYTDETDFPEVTEESETDTSPRGRKIRDAELVLMNEPGFETIVLRFGGLIGGKRHPVKYLAGRTGVSDPDAPVNLVERNDCIQAIIKVMEAVHENSVFNVVYPDHPPKESYYSEIAEKLDLEKPRFDMKKRSKGKMVSSEKLVSKGFIFKHPIS